MKNQELIEQLERDFNNLNKKFKGEINEVLCEIY